MNGVVIWYSKKDFRAVIWCEDSKELGIATGPTAWRNPMAPVEIGDFVSFTLIPVGTERRCRELQVIESRRAPALPDSIRKPMAHIVAKTRNPLLHLCSSRD
jgi:hypothetical protein